MIHINLYLKIGKLAIIILVVSYFVGITFYIYSDIVEKVCIAYGIDEYAHFLSHSHNIYLPGGL